MNVIINYKIEERKGSRMGADRRTATHLGTYLELTLALRDIEIIECLIACKLQSHSSIYVNFHKFTHAHVTYSYFVTACNTQPPEKFCIYVTVSVLCMP